MLRKTLAIGLSVWAILPAGFAQQTSIAPVKPTGPVIWRDYLPATVPPARLANTGRLREMVRAGKLYLTVQDAIALALENNVDIEVARYNPIAAKWRVERAQAGGALPGVPSGASQANSVASGQGVAGSQAAAGVSSTGAGTSGNNSANATVSQIGPVTQTLDPIVQEASTWSHKTAPQADIVQTITPVLISNSRVYTATYTQGYLPGGSASLTYTDHYLNENAPTDILNPSVAPSLSLSFQQPLLNGFGTAVNARTITVAKINYRTSDLTFKTTVINTVAEVLNSYYALTADYEDLKAKQSALETARDLYNNNKRQVEIGTLAQLDITSADSLLATGQQNLEDSGVTLQNDQLKLKNLLSRNGIADPVLASVEIIPVDKIVVPEKDDLAPLPELVKKALSNRADLLVEQANVQGAEVNALGTRNGILPTVVPFVAFSNAGLAGTSQPLVTPQGTETANPYVVGGIGKALGQVFRRDYPTERVGVYAQATVRNRQAQADFGIDQLQLRQTQLTTQKDLNQVGVDVANAVVALQQARARYDAVIRNRVLDQQLLDAEQRKFNLGASTPYNVVQTQRDLAGAQASEIAALVSYSNARVALDQALGVTLEANHVSFAEAFSGKVSRTPAAGL
jgi:outer membrane protein TolC